jgi:hypothetical protein
MSKSSCILFSLTGPQTIWKNKERQPKTTNATIYFGRGAGLAKEVAGDHAQ